MLVVLHWVCATPKINSHVFRIGCRDGFWSFCLGSCPRSFAQESRTLRAGFRPVSLVKCKGAHYIRTLVRHLKKQFIFSHQLSQGQIYFTGLCMIWWAENKIEKHTGGQTHTHTRTQTNRYTSSNLNNLTCIVVGWGPSFYFSYLGLYIFYLLTKYKNDKESKGSHIHQ